jgi:hypothetical protein
MSIRGSATHQKAQRYKYSKNNHFRRENKDLLKNFSKLERASQSTDGVNPLRRWAHDRFADSTNLDVSPEGLLPQGHVANDRLPALRLLARSERGALAGRLNR